MPGNSISRSSSVDVAKSITLSLMCILGSVGFGIAVYALFCQIKPALSPYLGDIPAFYAALSIGMAEIPFGTVVGAMIGLCFAVLIFCCVYVPIEYLHHGRLAAIDAIVTTRDALANAVQSCITQRVAPEQDPESSVSDDIESRGCYGARKSFKCLSKVNEPASNGSDSEHESNDTLEEDELNRLRL